MTFQYNDPVKHATLTAYAGRDFVYTFMPKYATRQPKALVGARAWMQLRDPKSNALFFEFKAGDLTLLIDAPTHSIIASASSDMTALWTFEEAKYDLVIEYANGGRYTEYTGMVIVNKEVTQINE
jgi:hypothetical protein